MNAHDLTDASSRQPVELPVVGYRSWRLGWNGELRSIGRGAITWMPGINTAACAHGFAHRAPDRDCDCGLYAYHRAGEGTQAGDEIEGAVVAWGQLHVHRDGFRAEHAQVVALAKRPGAGRGQRAGEAAAGRCHGAALVAAGELETVACEHGNLVDPAVIAQLDAGVAPVAVTGRARTRREILTDRTYETVARRVRAVPGLRTLLLCAHAYGLALSLLLWALLVIHWQRAGNARIGEDLESAVFSALFASTPALVAGAIHKARALARTRTRQPPWQARLLWPGVIALAAALPWLPLSWPITQAAMGVLAVGSGTAFYVLVLWADRYDLLELWAGLAPTVALAILAGLETGSARAVIAVVCVGTGLTTWYARGQLRLVGGQ